MSTEPKFSDVELERIPRGTDVLVITRTKNRENGRTHTGLRVFYDAGGGEMRPGKQGITIRDDELDMVLDALKRSRTTKVP